jgi:hypothetical protein
LKSLINFVKNAPHSEIELSNADITWAVALVVMTAVNEVSEVFLDRHKELYI